MASVFLSVKKIFNIFLSFFIISIDNSKKTCYNINCKANICSDKNVQLRLRTDKPFPLNPFGCFLFLSALGGCYVYIIQ